MLVPNEAKHYRTTRDNRKWHHPIQPSGHSLDGEVPNKEDEQLGRLYDCAIEEDIEMKLVEHQCRSKILQIEHAVKDDKQKGNQP